MRKLNDSGAYTDETERREFDLYNLLPTMVPHTPTGILVLTAYAAFVSADVGTWEDPGHNVHVALRSLDAAKDEVPALADVVDVVMKGIQSVIRSGEVAFTEWRKAEKKANEWRNIEEVFGRNGVNERLEENIRKRGPVRREEVVQKIAKASEIMPPEKVQSYCDYATLLVLSSKVEYAVEHLAKHYDHAGDLIRAKAKRYADMAARLPPEVGTERAGSEPT